MSETMALLRYVFRRHIKFLLILGILLLIGMSTAILAPLVMPGEQGRQIGFSGLAMSFAWCAFFSIALFDYGGLTQVTAGESGCNRWLLRMPIKAWKLAVVPVLLRSIWIAGLLILFLVVFRFSHFESEMPRSPYALRSFLSGCIFLAGVGAWLAGFSWRPYSNGWWRLGALGVFGLFAYFAFVMVIVMADPTNHRPRSEGALMAWGRSSLPISIPIGIVLFYGVGIWFSIRAICQAKVESHGRVPESAGTWFGERSVAVQSRKREHSNALRALAWYYFASGRPALRKAFVFMVPGIIVAILFMSLHCASLIVVFGWMIYTGAISVALSDQHGKRARFKSLLSSHMATIPVSTATLAWTRLATHTATLAGCMSMCLVVFAGWTLWPDNRETWWQWSLGTATTLGVPDQAMLIGLRYSAAIVIGVNSLLLFRWVALMWVGYAGRESWSIVHAVASGLLALVIIGTILGWFMKNATSWEHVQSSALFWLQYLPHLCGVLLTIKLICGLVATAWLIKWDLVSDAGVVKALLLWMLVAGGLGVGLWGLIPDPQATLVWCLTGSVLATPLARVMILPVMQRIDRVR